MTTRFKGVMQSPVTPLKEDYSLDLATFEKVLDFHVRTGATAISWPHHKGESLSLTIAERKDPVDFAALVRLGARIAAEEVLDDRHPIMGLLQLLGDVSDPATYAAHWPTSPLMQTAGVLDAATPFRSASSLAVASRQRLVGEPAWTFDSFELRGATASLAPVADRSFLEFGPGTTNADASHFVIFKRPEAVDASMAFLVDGTVRRNPSATTR